MSKLFCFAFRLKFISPNLQVSFYSSQPKRECKKDIGKVVNVAIIGSPNAGKSTLINRILERKVSKIKIVFYFNSNNCLRLIGFLISDMRCF